MEKGKFIDERYAKTIVGGATSLDYEMERSKVYLPTQFQLNILNDS